MAYPTSYDDYPEDEEIADKNVHGSQGGPENLPDTTGYHGADTATGDDRKTWNPDYSGL
jgi:hypothetical protein